MKRFLIALAALALAGCAATSETSVKEVYTSTVPDCLRRGTNVMQKQQGPAGTKGIARSPSQVILPKSPEITHLA